MPEEPQKRWTVRIKRWDVYVVEHVQAATTEQAQERGLEMYEQTEFYAHLDGGVNSVDAEPGDE